jgi:hypothetical protein
VSQAGLNNTTAGPVPPSVATTYQEDSGTATPALNILNVLGGTGVTTSGTGNTITINAVGGGFLTVDVTSATQTAAINTRYVTNRGAGVTYTLPATATEGDSIKFVGKLGLATIGWSANQQILFGSSTGTLSTGTLVSTNVGDCLSIVCTTSGASTIWRVDSAVGNWTIT